MTAGQQRQQPRTRGRAWQRIRIRQLRAHPLCAMCLDAGLVTQADEVDHIMPLFKGGTDHPSNLQSLCTPCHEAKTREDLGLRALGCDLNGVPVAPVAPKR